MGFNTATTNLFRACAPGGLALALILAGCTGQIIEDTSGGPVPPLTNLDNGVPVGGRGGQMPNSDSSAGGAGTPSPQASAGGAAPRDEAASGGTAGAASVSGVGGAAGAPAGNGGGTIGTGGTTTAQGGGPASPTAEPLPVTGTVVPLYSYPTNAAWRTVIDAKLAHPTVPVVAVINPANGPGASKNTDYANGISALVKAGVRVLGYVSTSYTKRAESLVKADIDTYRAWYPEVTGIFFDEQSNTVGGEDYYRRVDAYARSKNLTFTVGNPGADTAPSYVGTVDVILIYESSGLPVNKANADWHASYDRHNFGIIPYGVQMLDPAFIAQAKTKVGYLYVTGDTLPNPWDTVPDYFANLLAQLEK